MGDFMKLPKRNIESELLPPHANILLKKDIDRRTVIPNTYGDGAKKKGVVSISYYSNALAGTFTETVDLGSNTLNPAFVWFLQEVDKDETPMIDACQLVAKSVTVTGGTITVGWTASTLTLTAVTSNVGWPSLIRSDFYYVFGHDEPLNMI